MTDPIGDFIIRIKNAGMVSKETVSLPSSKMKLAIAELLSKKGFLGEVSSKVKDGKNVMTVNLLYREDGTPKVRDVQRISKPGRRIYEKAKDIKKFKRGFGISVFSTPKGILADSDAKEQNLGGEVLFKLW
jgi:small subunit ribosomal protein S8